MVGKNVLTTKVNLGAQWEIRPRYVDLESSTPDGHGGSPEYGRRSPARSPQRNEASE